MKKKKRKGVNWRREAEDWKLAADTWRDAYFHLVDAVMAQKKRRAGLRAGKRKKEGE